MKKYQSPKGDAIVGTVETLQATALIIGINDDGSPEWQGSTEIDWDSQATTMNGDKFVYICDVGEEWTFDQLTAVEETADA
jgi:hypothetical protein